MLICSSSWGFKKWVSTAVSHHGSDLGRVLPSKMSPVWSFRHTAVKSTFNITRYNLATLGPLALRVHDGVV